MNQKSQFDVTAMEQVNANFVNNDPLKISQYDSRGFFDEMFNEAGEARPGVKFLVNKLSGLSQGELQQRQRSADHELLNMGITFNVYGHSAGTEKVWPFDLIPRVIQEEEWLYIDHDQKIIRDGILPEYMIPTYMCADENESNGVTYSTMSHGEAWNFGRLGALLERADKTSRILDVKYYLLLPDVSDVGTPIDISQWGMLLKSTSALEMYRRRHGRLSPKQVAAFMLLDRDFPRAIRFCVSRAEQSLLAITGGTTGNFSNQPEQYLGRLRAEFDFLHIDDVMDVGLHEFIDNFQVKLNLAGDAICQTFFEVIPVVAS